MSPTAPSRTPRRLAALALAAAAVVLSPLAQHSRSEAAVSRADAFGIAPGGALQGEDPATFARDLDSISDLGARWLRVDINWAQIQHSGPSSYHWEGIDRLVRRARARGMNVLGAFMYSPDWARPPGAPVTWGPDPGQFAAFARRAAAHYSALGVHAFEIWNEPNIRGFWAPAPDVAAYTRLLEAAYPAIKAADPKATVLTGGTAPAGDYGGDYAPITFLEGIYANGGGGSFDAVGHHPYCWPAYPGDRHDWSAWYQMYGTNPSLRSVMAAHGDSGKEIWATEFGAPTNGPRGSHVSEAVQARMISRGYSLWRRYEWAGPMFAFQTRDQGTRTDTRENFFGLLRHDWSPKPAYHAYRQAVAKATGSPAPPATPPRPPTSAIATTTTIVSIETTDRRGGRAQRRRAVTGEITAAASSPAVLTGRVRMRVDRRIDGDWRAVSRKKPTRVGPQGGFRTRLGRFGPQAVRPGTYRIRARYLGNASARPSASRYRKFRVR